MQDVFCLCGVLDLGRSGSCGAVALEGMLVCVKLWLSA